MAIADVSATDDGGGLLVLPPPLKEVVRISTGSGTKGTSGDSSSVWVGIGGDVEVGEDTSLTKRARPRRGEMLPDTKSDFPSCGTITKRCGDALLLLLLQMDVVLLPLLLCSLEATPISLLLLWSVCHVVDSKQATNGGR